MHRRTNSASDSPRGYRPVARGNRKSVPNIQPPTLHKMFNPDIPLKLPISRTPSPHAMFNPPNPLASGYQANQNPNSF